MISAFTPRLTPIPFDTEIAKLTERFTGREWVFKEIDNWLKHKNKRFFVLTGEPGVGKSAIAARLTQIRDDVAAYHFCRTRDVETVRPGRILRSLAAQLGEHLPDYGQALANTIKPVFLRVEVNINIGSMTGSQVTGVYIENLKESDPANELDILIRAPLQELQKMLVERQQAQPTLVIILIDSLDEAVTTTGTNLVELLTQLSKSTSLPPWLRFILTSRPDRRVLRGFEPLKPYHLQETSDESLCDIRRYVEYRVAQNALQDLLEINLVQPQSLISEITALSQGNFLYTKLLLKDIEAGHQALDNLTELPKSIYEIYHKFLCRFSEEDWSKQYKPIFGVLTVAKEPISEKQISNFTHIDLEDVRDSIRIARQFFDVDTNEENKETYAIFHQSFRDYLLDEDHNPDFWCNAIRQHQRIVEYCWQYHPDDWRECDHYGLQYLTAHLIELAVLERVFLKSKSYTGKLYKLLIESPNWMQAKSKVFSGDASYSADLRLAINNIENCAEPDQLLILTQLFTAQSVVLQRVKQQTNVDLVDLVKAGREQQACEIARLRPSAKEHFSSLYLICNELPVDGELSLRLLDEAEAITDKIESASDRVKALCYLGITWHKAKAKAKVLEIFEKAQRVIYSIQDDEDREYATKYYVVALAKTKEFRVAEAMALDMDDLLDEKDEALRQLAFEVAQDGQICHAKEVARLIQFGQDEVLQLIDRPSDKKRLRYVNHYLPENVFSSLQSFEYLTNFSEDLIQIASALAQVSQFTQAKKIVFHISKQDDREKAWGRLVKVLVLEKQFDRAKEVSDYIQDKNSQAEALIQLGLSLYREKQPVKADEVFRKVETVAQSLEPRHKSLVMKQIAIALAKARLFDEAKTRIEFIQDKNSQAEALIQLGLSLHREKQPIKADEVFRKVETVAQSLEPRTEILKSLAIALVMTQRLKWAEEIARSIQLDEYQAITLEKLAVAWAQVGDFASAKRIVNNINEDKLQAKALLQIAAICSQEKHQKEVDRLLHQVSEILSSIGVQKGIHYQVHVLSQIADELSEFKHHPEVNQIFSKAEEKVRSISFPEQDISLGSLATAMVGAGRFNKARKVIGLMVEEIEKNSPLHQLACGLADVKEFDQAEEIARLIKYSMTQGETLMDLVTAAARAKQLKRAERIAHSIESDWYRLLALNQVAEALAQERYFKKALTVLPVNEVHSFLATVAKWTPIFKEISLPLSVEILQNALRIAAWLPAWQQFYRSFNHNA